MATLTVQNAVLTGLTVASVAAAGGGDAFPNNGKVLLQVTNGAGSGSVNVTVASQVPASAGIAPANNVVAVGFGTTKLIGPFPVSAFTAADTGLAAVTYSGVTSITVAAIQVP
jgi:hypothetical protein